MTLVDGGGYAAAAPIWLTAGWAPLPLPHGQKAAPPTGYTGDKGVYPDEATVTIWIGQHPNGNLALRMPPGIVGIDIDAYKNTTVIVELDKLEQRLGVLPATYASTSGRCDGSGILLYRLPEPMALRDQPIEGIDIIQRHHRYVVAWPSIHPEGRPYQLLAPDGTPAEHVPTLLELTELPAEWVDYLREPTIGPQPITLTTSPATTPSRGESWFDSVVHDFNTRTTWDQILGAHGWTLHHTGGRIEYWRHPTATHPKGWSATIGATEAGDRLVVHSTSTIFPSASSKTPAPSYDRFDAWCYLKHGGNDTTRRTTAARTARKHGYGPPEPANRPSGHTSHPSAPETTPTLYLPNEFWTARPLLTHIRNAAHSANRSGDAVLHGVLVRMCSMVPHTIRLPAIVGATASLNYFAALVGPSGAGKTSAVAITKRLLPIGIAVRAGLSLIDDRPLGSGEGIAELYMGTIEQPGDDGKTKRVRGQEWFHVFLYIAEGDALSAQADRKGTTLLESLRRAWSGETLGQSNASQDRTRVVNDYRLGLVAGFQPERAGRLLADEIGGTPQRFTFAMATDPAIPDERPDWPGPLPWEIPNPGLLHRYATLEERVHHVMRVAGSIATTIRNRDLARARGLTADDALDSHGDLQRLKIAGLLALLDGRMDITNDDWELAGIAWECSRAVRSWVIAAVAAEAERDELSRIERHVRRELTVDAARAEAPDKIETLATRLARWLHENHAEDDGCTRRDLSQRLKGSERAHLDTVIDDATNRGWITTKGDKYVPGTSRPA